MKNLPVKVLSSFLVINRLELESVMIGVPMEVVLRRDFAAAEVRVWRYTRWIINQYEKQPDMSVCRNMNRIYACLGLEADFACIDEVIKILGRAGWTPECAITKVVDLERKTPVASLRQFERLGRSGQHGWAGGNLRRE